MVPMYRLEFNAPTVKVPPGSRGLAWETLEKRVIWKAITGSSHAPDEASVCRKDSVPDAAIDCHTGPMREHLGDR